MPLNRHGAMKTPLPQSWTLSRHFCRYCAKLGQLQDALPGLSQALEWQAARTPEEVIAAREDMIAQLELAAAELEESGKNRQWFGNCDEAIRKASGCKCLVLPSRSVSQGS